MPPDIAVTEALSVSLLRHVERGQRLVVGYSGGLDSTVLLHALAAVAPAHGAALAALHVNHGLSGNADAWQAHCVSVCASWHIPLDVRPVVVERNSDDGIEAAARRARHTVYAEADADWIVLGHHADDQAETLLFNLLRGCGVAGAGGMAETNGRLLRPLLTIGRPAISRYASDHGLHWVDDESNADRRLSRNHIRHELLAGLESRFPGSSANLAAAARRFREARSLLDDLARCDLGANANDFPLPITALAPLPEARARNVVRYLLQRRHVGIPGEERLREALAQMLGAAPDRHPAIRFGRHVMRRRKGYIVLDDQGD